MISEGNIYKIICTLNNDVYIGSTFNLLKQRWQTHKSKFKYWLQDNNRVKCSICENFKKYGIENFKIILIKKYLVYREHRKDSRQLEAYEQLWINKLNCVNTKCAFQPLIKKQYYIAKKKTISEKKKVKITCECGSIISKHNKAPHIRTAKHKNYINNIN